MSGRGGGFEARFDAEGALVLRLPGFVGRIMSLGRARSCGCPRPPDCPGCLSVELEASEEAALARVLAAEQQGRGG